MTTATRTQKSPSSPPETDLPPITDGERQANDLVRASERPHFASVVTSVRYYDPQTGRTLAMHFADLEIGAIELLCDDLERRGYVPCVSPDAPRPSPASEPTREKADETSEQARRAGQRNTRSKSSALFLPFGKYKGTPLQEVERNDPDYVDWLADNATMPDVRKAAQKLVNQRDDEDMPDMPF